MRPLCSFSHVRRLLGPLRPAPSRSAIRSDQVVLEAWQPLSHKWRGQLQSVRGLRAASQAPKPNGEKSHGRPASELNHNVSKEEQEDFERRLVESKDKQIRTPWHRDGSDTPPVGRQRSAGAMTKGKILTTPTRLFKLILPLTTRDYNKDRKDIQPLALVVHPSQPLSYLQLLIQAELPRIKSDGAEKVAEVHFLAVDSMHDSKALKARRTERAEDLDKLEKPQTAAADELRGGPGEAGVETYSGAGQTTAADAPAAEDFVRWSKSTEIGDFVRDAARGKEFAIEIEGAPREIRVGVPSFADRTFYLRTRLRKRAREISRMAGIKSDCDFAAYRRGQNIAYLGFAGVVAWGGVVTYLTFLTDAGWDLVEPITYLAGLVVLLVGYGWFLIHNRDASYRSAMNITVSKRQHQLYQQRGFDLERWHALVEEGNALRREIKAIANEYDVEWDERVDAKDETVVEALREERHKHGGKKEDGDDDGGGGGGDGADDEGEATTKQKQKQEQKEKGRAPKKSGD